jgi:hypothetical protein
MPVVESAIPVPSKLNLTETFVSLVTLFTSPIRALAAEHHPKKNPNLAKYSGKKLMKIELLIIKRFVRDSIGEEVVREER